MSVTIERELFIIHNDYRDAKALPVARAPHCHPGQSRHPGMEQATTNQLLFWNTVETVYRVTGYRVALCENTEIG